MTTVKIEWQGDIYIVEGNYYPKRNATFFEPEESATFFVHKVWGKDYSQLPPELDTEHGSFWDEISELCIEAYYDKELEEAEERAILNYEFSVSESEK